MSLVSADASAYYSRAPDEALRWGDQVAMVLGVRHGDVESLHRIADLAGMSRWKFIDGPLLERTDPRMFHRLGMHKRIHVDSGAPFMAASVEVRDGSLANYAAQGAMEMLGIQMDRTLGAIRGETRLGVYVAIGQLIAVVMKGDQGLDMKVLFVRQLGEALRRYVPFAADDMSAYQGEGL